MISSQFITDDQKQQPPPEQQQARQHQHQQQSQPQQGRPGQNKKINTRAMQLVGVSTTAVKYIKIEGLNKVVEDDIFTCCQAIDKMKLVLFRVKETLDEKKISNI